MCMYAAVELTTQEKKLDGSCPLLRTSTWSLMTQASRYTSLRKSKKLTNTLQRTKSTTSTNPISSLRWDDVDSPSDLESQHLTRRSEHFAVCFPPVARRAASASGPSDRGDPQVYKPDRRQTDGRRVSSGGTWHSETRQDTRPVCRNSWQIRFCSLKKFCTC